MSRQAIFIDLTKAEIAGVHGLVDNLQALQKNTLLTPEQSRALEREIWVQKRRIKSMHRQLTYARAKLRKTTLKPTPSAAAPRS